MSVQHMGMSHLRGWEDHSSPFKQRRPIEGPARRHREQASPASPSPSPSKANKWHKVRDISPPSTRHLKSTYIPSWMRATVLSRRLRVTATKYWKPASCGMSKEGREPGKSQTGRLVKSHYHSKPC